MNKAQIKARLHRMDDDAVAAAVALDHLRRAICMIDFLGGSAREFLNAMVFEDGKAGNLDEWDKCERFVVVTLGGGGRENDRCDGLVKSFKR